MTMKVEIPESFKQDIPLDDCFKISLSLDFGRSLSRMMLPPNSLDYEEAEKVYEQLIKKKEAEQQRQFPKSTPSVMPSLGGIKPNKPEPWLMCSFMSHIVTGGVCLSGHL